MSTEMYWLSLTVLMTALLWVPYILDRIVVVGLWPALAQPKPEPGVQSAWADRASKAHTNAIENLAVFAPAVLLLNSTGVSTAATKQAAMVYFFARLVHFIVYTAGIPVLRTLAFAVGSLASLVILASALHWM